MSTKGYCMQCRQMRDIVDGKEVRLLNDSVAIQGFCNICKTKIIKKIAYNPLKKYKYFNKI
jgi:hypothetical protein